MSFFQRNAKYIVILAVVASSTSGILSKMITATSMAIGFYRLTFALPVFVIPVIIKNWNVIKKLPVRDIVLSMIAGAFLFMHFLCWFSAVKHTAIASGVVLASLHPLIVMITTLLVFKKKEPLPAVLGIVIALLGGTMLAGFDYRLHAEQTFGNLLAFGAAVGMGIYFVIGNEVRKRVSSAIYISILFATCWGLFFVGMLVTKTPFTGYPPEDWLWLILATALCQFGAHGIFNWAMVYVSSLFVSAWGTGEIVAATIFAYFIFGEIPTIWQIAGAVIVMAGLLLYNFAEEGSKENDLQS